MNPIISPELQQFSRKIDPGKQRNTAVCVIYTRVSSREQAENNSSLDSQKRYCTEYAAKKSYRVAEYFGGTFESAKSDERKEFKRMIEYVKKNHRIDTIIVYSYDRFSRSGTNAVFLSEELKIVGVKVIAVSQEVDTNTASGRFQQSIFYLFSQFDNEQRKDKVVKGMIENIRNGFWVGQTPFGYTNLNRKDKAKNHQYRINQDGELLKKGFQLKADGVLTNIEIVSHLNKLGCNIHYKSFIRILSNPFYCGYIVSSLIPNEIFKGNHPALVSEYLFLKANNVITQNPHNGISKQFKIEALPLKGFVKDEVSLSPFTGYRQKGIYYYKTRDEGTCVNINAEYLNNRFKENLKHFEFDKDSGPELRESITELLGIRLESQLKEQQQIKSKITELIHKIEKLEERYVQGEIEVPLFQKFSQKYQTEKAELEKMLPQTEINSSNLSKIVEKGLKIAVNLSETWALSHFDDKRKLQTLVFPEGILYNKQKDTVRTPRINSIFAPIPVLSSILKDGKKRDRSKSGLNSHLVVPTGIEPASKV